MLKTIMNIMNVNIQLLLLEPKHLFIGHTLFGCFGAYAQLPTCILEMRALYVHVPFSIVEL